MSPIRRICCTFIIVIFMCLVLCWYFTQKDINTTMSKLKRISSIQIKPLSSIDIRITDTYAIIETLNNFDPSTILYVFQEYPNITHVIWFKPFSFKDTPQDIIHYVGDSFISLIYDTKHHSFRQDFIITQKSKFTMRLLSALAKSQSNEFLEILKKHIDEKIHDNPTTFIRTYFTFIFIDTIERENKKFIIENRIINTENKNICQTWVSHETNVEFLFRSSESIKSDYPDYNYHLFDDFEMKKFISTFYSQDVVNRYDSILPTAFKSDFFRYLYLYKFGGFYFDITLISVQPLINYIDISNYDFICPYDLGYDTENPNQLYQAFMYARQNHPYLKKCIKTIMEYDISKHISYSCLSVTGPKLIGNVVYNDHETKSNNLFLRHVDGNKITLGKPFDNITILYTRGNFKTIPIGKLMYKESQKNHYSKHCVSQSFFYN